MAFSFRGRARYDRSPAIGLAKSLGPEWSCGHPCPHRWLFEPDGRLNGRLRSRGLLQEAEALRCGQGCPHDRCGRGGAPVDRQPLSKPLAFTAHPTKPPGTSPRPGRRQPGFASHTHPPLLRRGRAGPGRWPCKSLRRRGLTRQKQRFQRASRRFGAGWRSTQRRAITIARNSWAPLNLP